MQKAKRSSAIRLITMVWIITTFLSACSEPEPKQETQPNYTYGVYALIIEEEEISNDHVGNDWSFTYTCDGEPIKSGHTLTCPLGIFHFQHIQVQIQENDKIPDVASGQLVFGLCDGGRGSAVITVTESDGNYEGNTAVWRITCTVKLVGKQ